MRLSVISENIAKPVVKTILFNPASVTVQFPNGESWQYRVYDNNILNNLIYKYGRNVGKFVAALKKFESVRIKPVSEAIDFASMFGDDDYHKRPSVVSVGPEEARDAVLQLYRGFNADIDSLETDGDDIILSPKRSEQGMMWFTHSMINHYDPIEYVSGRGQYLLTYDLNCKKHFKIIEYDDGSTSERIPQPILDLSIPNENCRFYMGYELPHGWVFSYKNEKFIGCSDKLRVKRDMITRNF